MPAPDYTLRQIEGCLVIQIEADNLLGINEVNRIGQALDALVEDRPGKTVLDLTKVRYAGSAALGMLVSISKRLTEHGGRLLLCGTEHLEPLFKVSRMLAVFDVAADVQAAVMNLNG